MSGFFYIGLLRLISFIDLCPTDYMPEVLEILGSSISIVDVVRMLPYITGEERCWLSTHWSGRIGCWDNLEWSICIFNEPSPSRTECSKCYLVEFFLKRLDTPPGFDDPIAKISRMENIEYWSQRIKIKSMIPDLCSIVEYSSCWSSSDDIFKRKTLVLRSWNELVEIIHIGLMMFSMMEIDSLKRDIWSEWSRKIWKRWKGM